MKKTTKPAPANAPDGDSLMVHVPDATRGDLIAALATMPEEAFGWFVVWAARGKPSGAGGDFIGQMFPDGLGGFSHESRASIEALRSAAVAFVGQSGKP